MSNKNIIDTYKNIYNLSESIYKEKVDFDFLAKDFFYPILLINILYVS